VDKPKLKLPAGKGKKIAALLLGVAVVGGGFAILHSTPAPQPAPPLTAKQAMEAARVKLASEGHAPTASRALHRQASAADPAHSESVAAAGNPVTQRVAAPASASTTPMVGHGPAVASSAAPASATTTTTTLPAAAAAPAEVVPVAVTPPVPSAPVPMPALQSALPTDVPQAVAAPSAQGGRDYTAYYDAIGGLSRTVRFLEMKAKIAELQRKIDGTDSGNGSATLNPASPMAIMPPPAMPAHKTGPTTSADAVMPPLDVSLSAKADPSLRSVMMVDGKFQAVVYTHGADLSVREGASIGDGWIVRAIRDSSVTLAKGKQSKTLNIGG
jgi:type IV pilus biogenesis protein PilP